MKKYHSDTRQEMVVCPHCGKEGPKAAHRRYHFDNCPKLTGHPVKNPRSRMDFVAVRLPNGAIIDEFPMSWLEGEDMAPTKVTRVKARFVDDPEARKRFFDAMPSECPLPEKAEGGWVEFREV